MLMRHYEGFMKSGLYQGRVKRTMSGAESLKGKAIILTSRQEIEKMRPQTSIVAEILEALNRGSRKGRDSGVG